MKFHSGKLSALRYLDFDTSPLPRLDARLKIDLKGQRLDEFDHTDEDQRLLLKSRFMAQISKASCVGKRLIEKQPPLGLNNSAYARRVEIIQFAKAAGRSLDGWRWATRVRTYNQ